MSQNYHDENSLSLRALSCTDRKRREKLQQVEHTCCAPFEQLSRKRWNSFSRSAKEKIIYGLHRIVEILTAVLSKTYFRGSSLCRLKEVEFLII